MSGWFWLGLVLLLIAAFLAIRIRVTAAYDEAGFAFRARFGRITLFRYPRQGGPAKLKEKMPKKPKTEEPEAEKPKQGGKLPGAKEFLSIIGDTLGKLKRKLRVDELTLWYCSASRDPFSAAMAFGGASAGIGMLMEPLEGAFRIKKRDIRTAVSFTDTEPTVILKLSLSLSVFAVFCIGVPLAFRFLRRPGKKKE